MRARCDRVAVIAAGGASRRRGGGSRRAIRREAASSTGPLRRQVRSAMTGAGVPSGPANCVGEAGQHAHIRAAEGVDRLVGVAHRHQVPAVPRQGLQQRLLRRVAVLVLIDEHRVVGVPLPLPGGRRAEQPGGDPDDLRVVVGGHRRQVEPRGVAVEERARRHPVVPLAPPAELAQGLAVQAPLRRAHQDVAQLLGEAPGRERGTEPLGPVAAPSAVSPRSSRRISSSCSGAESSRGGWSPASTNSRRTRA